MISKEKLRRLCVARDLLKTNHFLDEVAQATALSRYHFVREFKSVFGETPVQYRTRLRLDQAKYLLLNSEDSITDICLNVGFSSLSSFSTLFAARFGRSPKRYRLEAKAGADLSPHCMTLFTASRTQPQISRSVETPN